MLPTRLLLLALALLTLTPLPAFAQDDQPTLVVVAGSFQSEAGCPGDWQPDCESTALTYNAASGLWEATFTLPKGGYEYKVALGGGWTENYGRDGQPDGPNIPLGLVDAGQVTFTYDHATHLITDSLTASGGPVRFPEPDRVVIPGTLQSEVGCSGDWQPDCDQTALTYDAADGVWQGTFLVQPGDDQDARGPRYKVALNGSWDENYGANAQRGGADIPLVVAQPTEVKFYYDHQVHWVADSVNTVIAVATGTFQSEAGCAQDNDPGCLRTWLRDAEGTGTLSFAAETLPPGDYEVVIAIDESMDETFGEAGQPGGAPIRFAVKEGAGVYIAFNPKTHEVVVSTAGAPRGNLRAARAHWLARDTIAWPVDAPAEGVEYRLYYDPAAGLKLDASGLSGGPFIPLQRSAEPVGGDLLQRYPHLAGAAVLRLDPAAVPRVPEMLTGQLAIAAVNAEGRVLDATSLQLYGVLDDLFTYSGPLGVSYQDTPQGRAPTLRLWAPTARSVVMRLFKDSSALDPRHVPMTLDPATGVWSLAGEPGWTGMYYLYQVEVYAPATGAVERNVVTDPYSLSLARNSTRSQIVDLADPALMPAGWDTLAKPPLAAPEDAVIYELHVRDFSATDPSVPTDLRGTFAAFALPDSNGVKHLRALAQAGLTHVHLLPVFDIASVDEDRSTWQALDEAQLAALPPNSDQPANSLNLIKEQDGFNWGYDPYHYTAPEGSYATDPDGPARILEFRQMVQALNGLGLRVVMDVVYNHTTASGQADKSVLDKIVPGYYHRLDADGRVETSTCCQNTATEHAMMEKLMVDSLVTWATAYKVDGFRFDLMGHHMLANMVNVRHALDGLTPASAGVDGASIYVYGEGWDFGEVANSARGVNATQRNLAGTGIGVFNDRLRDAARGGGPFSDPREQGFLTGLFTAPSAFHAAMTEADQRARLLRYSDWIRTGLAGNLRDYRLVRADGQEVTAAEIDYNGAPAGYTLDPQENIVYISAHDNETLFDAIQWKAPAAATAADRTRMQNLGLSLVLLAQGVPFFQAGDDLLRSKSLDGNSYNSGDWFNRLDFTYASNNWGAGLPPFATDRWPLMADLLGNPALQPAPADIQSSATHFREMLQIRRSSPLFRLRTAEDVLAHLTFLNTGPDQVPGLIVMRLSGASRDLDPNYSDIVVAFNAQPGAVSYSADPLKGLRLDLHPIQQQSADPVLAGASFASATGTLVVPARSTAVFVARQSGAGPLAVTGLGLAGIAAAGFAGYAVWRRRRAAPIADSRRPAEGGGPPAAER